MECPSHPAPEWASHIQPAIEALLGAAPGHRNAARARLWRLLHASLFASLRAQAGRVAPFTHEDLEDLASGKALELLQQAEGNRWTTSGHGPREVAGFVTRVARNGLIDLARRRGREAPLPEDAEGWDLAVAGPVEGEVGPLELTIADEFLAGLRECVMGLTARARQVWMQRVVLDRPSRETAGALGLSVANVDVVAQRAREALAACMGRKGHSVSSVHPRAFVALWWRSEPQRWADEAEGGEEIA